MQTPSHVAFSLFFWRHVPNCKETLAVVFGAILPDLAMFVFYGYQKMVGSKEMDIWQTLYFQEGWQWFFDVFNSIPIFFVLAVVCYFNGWRIGFLISASALLHVLCDFPVHNDDAHRHFLPFSNWRFMSPLSYWDPKHYGVYAMIAEFILAVLACITISSQKNVKSIRIAGYVTLSLYIAAVVLALVFWFSMMD